MIDETILQQEQEAFLRDTLQMLLAQDSPTGFTGRAVDLAEGIAREQGFETRRTNKGNLFVNVPAGRAAAAWGSAPTWTRWA